MILFRRAALALLASLLILALPAAASAATYEVDSTADEADAGVGIAGCLTAGLKCTLRAAIEESNASTGVKDTVDFTAAFNGQLADTIAITLGEIQITDEVAIDGDDGAPCTTDAAVGGPCVGVSGAVGLDVLSDDVEIRGLAITGAGIGIAVLNESTGFTAADNWLGVKLDGSAGANTTGIFVDPGSDSASIGGVVAADRNVFANSSNEGLDLEGASDAVVRGNYFGVAPDGTTQMANAKNLEVTDSSAGSGFPAEGNEIGATIEGAALTSEACDGGCNVVSGATGTGIDLNGNGPAFANEEPASGPTTVHGNFVGLDKAGTGVIANGNFGILVGGADEATIGGPGSEANANFIAGGAYGIYHENGEAFVAESNQIGVGPVTAATTSAPSEVGIFVFGLTNVEPSTIEANAVRMTPGAGVAIEQRFLGATIAGNLISGGATGILTTGSGATGNLIADNMLGSVGGNGILVKSNINKVVGNLVLSSGAAGIRVQSTDPPFVTATTENVIGGDLADEENEISNSGGDAVEIVNFEETANEVGRNKGKLNGGLFIDLVATNPGTEPNGPNEGIEPPPIAALTTTSASGTGAEEGAIIRVFRKGSAEAGELESFLGETTADPGGDWKVDYPAAIPGGTIVAATQTSKGATSELATATTPGGNEGGGGNNGGGNNGGGNNGGGNNGGGNGGGNNGGAKDKTPPDTKILKGPPKKTHKRTVKFKFASTEAGSTFQCKLDRKPFKACASPKKYKKLKPGKHLFKVRAIDQAGNVDPTPAKRKFIVLK